MYPVVASYLGTESDAPSAAWSDPISLIFKDINSKQNEVRSKGIANLHAFVAQQSQDMKGEYFASFINDVNHYIKDLTKGTSQHAVLGGILSINVLLSVEFDTNDGTIATQWTNYLRTALMQSTSIEVSRDASRCLGKLARIYQGAMHREILDLEVREALEWLSQKDIPLHKKLTGVYILADLYQNVPALISFEHVDTFISLIQTPLQHADLNLRNGVVEVVRWSLRLIKMRAPEFRHSYYRTLYEMAESLIKNPSTPPDSLHGAIIFLSVLLVETGTFMADKIDHLSTLLVSLQDHGNVLVRSSLIEIVPQLAKFDVAEFSKHHLQTWIAHLVKHAQIDKAERRIALSSIAKLSTLMGFRMIPHVNSVMSLIDCADTNSYSPNNNGKNGDHNITSIISEESLECLGAMAVATGEAIAPYLNSMLPQILAADFNQKLVDTVSNLAKSVPSVRQTLQDSLLNILSLILAHEPITSVAPTPTSSAAATPREPGSSLTSSSSLGSYSPGSSLTSSLSVSPRPKENFDWSKTYIVFTKPFTPIVGRINSNAQKGNDDESLPIEILYDASKTEMHHSTYGSTSSFYQDSEGETSVSIVVPTNAELRRLPPDSDDGNSSNGSEPIMPISITLPSPPSTISSNTPVANRTKDSLSLGSRDELKLELPSLQWGLKGYHISDGPESISKYILALDTLATYDFKAEITKHLIHKLVVNYLDHKEPAIRKRSVIACAKLLLQQGELKTLKGYSARLTNHVLERLFTTALTDRDNSIRHAVLTTLDGRFDAYLSQTNFLKHLFLLLYDPSFEMRELTVDILSRLASKNPGYIFPPIRVLLLELLKNITDSLDVHTKESSARLLGRTIQKFPAIATPYVKPITTTLTKVAIESDISKIVAYSISGLGDLSEVAGLEMVPFLDEILPPVIEAFSDQTSSSKREKGLKALSQIIQSTGYVVDELLSKYPKLLDTILNKIKREDTGSGRIELIRLLGIVGALDPYRYKELQLSVQELEDKAGSHQPTDLMKGITWTSPDYYPCVTLNSLIKFLRNPYGSHATFQPLAIQGIMTIFKSLGVKCVPYLKHFMPLFQKAMRLCGDALFGFRELVFQQLCLLLSVIKHFTRDYIEDLWEMIQVYWTNPKLLPYVLSLVEEISHVLGDEFRPMLSRLVPMILGTLQADVFNNYQNTARILKAIEDFGQMIDEYVYLFVPVLLGLLTEGPSSLTAASGNYIHLMNSSNHLSSSSIQLTTPRVSMTAPAPPPVPVEIQYAALSCLSYIVLNHDVAKYTISIIRVLSRFLTHSALPSLAEATMDALASVAISLNQDFKGFMPMVQAAASKVGIKSARYAAVCACIDRGDPIIVSSLPRSELSFIPRTPSPMIHASQVGTKDFATPPLPLSTMSKSPSISTPIRPRSPGQPIPDHGFEGFTISHAWDTSRCFTKTDWTEWMRRLSIVLLAESSSSALRSCAALAKAHYPLARELFNPAFICCWNELTYELQTALAGELHSALSSQTIPPDILQILLDLAEFMEHNEKSLPIDPKELAGLAVKCHAYAKALYYKEAEYRNGVNATLVEDIISINYQLQHHEAAQGMLRIAQETPGITIKLSWYEKLQKWSTALEAYEKQQVGAPFSIDIELGRMRCLHDLGKWDALNDLCAKNWPTERHGPKKMEIATLALSAALNLNRWDLIDIYVNALSESSLDGSFYRAVQCLNQRKMAKAKEYINMAREIASTELTALIAESYNRSYGVVVRIQQLSELEEISTYMMLEPDDDVQQTKRNNILELWRKRLMGVERNVEVWQSLLSIRSLVEPPEQNIKYWNKFANLVRKSNRPNKAKQIISLLLRVPSKELTPGCAIPDHFPMVKCSYFTLLWTQPATRVEAINQMEAWVSTFGEHTNMTNEDQATCYSKLAKWKLAHHRGNLNDQIIQQIHSTAKSAIEKAGERQRVWRIWALVNYRFVTHYESLNSPKLDAYLGSAINGFIISVRLSTDDDLQGILQLLTLWFRHGKKKEVETAMNEAFSVISVDKWLSAIPQLMARIHVSLRSVRLGIHKLLTELGKHHPQALVFPLIVAKQSPFATRVTAAQSIVTSMKQYNADLLDETWMVSSELIRVAILWKEKWYKSLDEASRYYYIEKKIDAMALTLQRLNDMLEKGPETVSEQTFVKVFGRDLAKAWEATKEYLKTGKVASINAAWDLYGQVFRTIKRQLTQDFDKLHLKNVSPKLLNVNLLSLSVPGTYAAGKELVRIKSFNPVLKVIPSKQQPRKIVIKGSDGLDYGFLLKGHEDLRQDERVMQLFGLVNTFFSADQATAKSHLSIRTFAVVPLSPNTGLIEWVPQCDTIHELIKQYRSAHNIPIDAEQMIITRLVPKPDIYAYYKLTALQKLEVFQAALDGTSAYDLERAFYLNSKGSEDWLERRTTYTRSLAVISMVGYILGLGDRHPNNFLLSRTTGKIMHIDFGDCFEVAMHREKHAEKFPFRLTRMLVAAMEVSGIQGTFKYTSEAVMRVLRANADSIIAVLEAFVYDPLINWRLITQASPVGSFGDNNNTGLLNPMDTANPLDDPTNPDRMEEHGPSPAAPSGIGSGEAFEFGAATTKDANLEVGDMHEALNAKALSVIQRINNKLSGKDFGNTPLEEETQVELLIKQAISVDNLSAAFLGFCGYW